MPRPFPSLNAHSALAARRVAHFAGAAALAGLGLGCGQEAPLQRIPEPFTLVPGPIPGAESAPPLVEIDGPGAGDFRLNRVHQCDRFPQTARAVDILWVVDTSSSMREEQEKLARHAEAFVQRLVGGSFPVDFHLGVITTDVDTVNDVAGLRPGVLRALPGGKRWIACTPAGGSVSCNVGDADAAVNAFGRLVRVGSSGSPEEKGLLAVLLATEEPLNQGFFRDDAALSVIFVSDEDDSSCSARLDQGPCVAAPSCRCDETSNWGSIDWFARFFRGLKGYGNESLVRVGAIVASDPEAASRVLDFQDGSGRTYVGCTSDSSSACAVAGGEGAECAFHAPRYLAMAERTGGIAADICADDFTPALDRLGLVASGLQTEFRLSRAPIRDTIDVVVVPNEADLCNDAATCSNPSETCVRGKCARRVTGGLPEGWEHVICSGGTVRNLVRFSGRSIPEPLSTVEVCYDVDVGADLSKCQ